MILMRKRKLWKRARCGPEELRKYREAEKKAENAVRNAKRNFEKKLAKEQKQLTILCLSKRKDKGQDGSRTTERSRQKNGQQ